MKTLYLVRHAKSDWENETLQDIDRPLNERGYKDAHLISTFLSARKLNPDLILTSPAIRALSTAVIFARNLDYGAEKIRLEEALYESGTGSYMEVIRSIQDTCKLVLLFGHNPTITQLSNRLTGQDIENIPTTGFVKVTFAEDAWKNINQGVLEQFDFPKNHYNKTHVR